MILGCGIPEGLHCGNLVLDLDVAVGHLIVGNLADGVSPGRHPGIILYRTLVILHGVEQGPGVEIILPVIAGGNIGPVIVFLGLCSIAGHEIGLGYDSGEMRPPFFRNPRIEGLAVLHNIFVILVHKPAFKYIER